MQLRKYTKVFKNRESAMKFQRRMEYRADKEDFDADHYPRVDLSFDHSDRNRFTRYTVTYYLNKYKINPANKTTDSELYGKNIMDVKRKFMKLMVDNFPNYKVVIKKVVLIKDRGDQFNEYRITHTMKNKK